MMSMAFQDKRDFARGQVDQFDEAISRPRCQALAIVRKIEAENGIGVNILEIAEQIAGGDIPELDLAPAAWLAAAAGEGLAVVAEGEGVDAIGEGRVGIPAADGALQDQVRRKIPEIGCPVGGGGEKCVVTCERKR